MKKLIYILLSYLISIILSVDLSSQFNTDYVGGIYTTQIDTPYITYKNPNLLNRNAVNIKKYKIRSITEATQYYRKWKYEDTLFYENKYEYDTNGCLIKWKYLNTFITILERHGDFTKDPIDSALYVYNKNYLVSEKITYHKAYYTIHKYDYDSRNNLVSIGIIYDSLNIDNEFFFEFDNDNNLKVEKEYWDIIDDTISVVYNRPSSFHLICKSVYPDRDIKTLWEFKYSKNKDTVYFTKNDEWVFGKEYLYKNSRLSRIISNSTNDVDIETFFYEDNNQLVKVKTQHWGWNKINYYNYPDKTWYDEYKYNSNGLLDEIVHYYSNWKPSYKKVLIYEYYE